MSSSCTYSLILSLSFLVTLIVSICDTSFEWICLTFTVIAARDGFIQADKNRYDYQHFCLIWKAFAKHGLGVDAHGTTDGFKVPPDCYRA